MVEISRQVAQQHISMALDELKKRPPKLQQTLWHLEEALAQTRAIDAYEAKP